MHRLLVVFLLIVFPLNAFAMDKIRKNNFKAIDKYIEQMDTKVPKDLIRAIAWVESRWTQYNKDGTSFIDGSMSKITGIYSKDFGILQINERTIELYKWKASNIKCNFKYNIKAGVTVFEDKAKYIQHLKKNKNWKSICKKYKLKKLSDIDTTILAYNGLNSNHIYLKLVKKAWKEHSWDVVTGTKVKYPIIVTITGEIGSSNRIWIRLDE
jgi:hypothetical protein